MKWPSSLTLIRHGESVYNELKARKEKDKLYRAFKAEFNKNPESARCQRLAKEVEAKFALGVSDYSTPLTDQGKQQAFLTGLRLKTKIAKPDVVFVSPYLRTQQTLEWMIKGWADLAESKTVPEDRIREKEHGLSLLYNDWRVFHVLHPDQRKLRNLLGPYWYQFPQGESTSQVRDRIRSMMNVLVREYEEQNVLMITHHLTILSIRSVYERLSPEQFIDLDENAKPRNCGVTTYLGDPGLGVDGRLVLSCYNECLWEGLSS